MLWFIIIIFAFLFLIEFLFNPLTSGEIQSRICTAFFRSRGLCCVLIVLLFVVVVAGGRQINQQSQRLLGAV